jgi:hypothetical protein
MTNKRKSGSAYRCVALYLVHGYQVLYTTVSSTVLVLCSFELLEGSDWLNQISVSVPSAGCRSIFLRSLLLLIA